MKMKNEGVILVRTLDTIISYSGREASRVCSSVLLITTVLSSEIVPYCAFMHELSSFNTKAYLKPGKLDFMMGWDKDQEKKGLNLVQRIIRDV